jgi:protease-4
MPRKLLPAFALVAVALGGCIQIDLFGGGRGGLVESVVRGHRGPKILMLEIDGVIQQEEQSGPLGPARESTVARIREQLDRARQDRQIRALLLRINTPGGGATASDLIHAELMRFKRQRDVPVVAHLLGMATSGGYYVAMAADRVVAEPTTVTGSIGVIFVGVNFAGLMERWGIEDQTVAAGAHKDAGSPLRRMTRDERRIFEGVVGDLHDRFQQVVTEGRPKLDRLRVEALADGRIYSARQALENGLVDQIGSLEDSIGHLEKQLGVSESVVVSYHRRHEWRQNLYTRAPVPSPAAHPAAHGALDPALVLGAMTPGFHYLWWPGAR